MTDGSLRIGQNFRKCSVSKIEFIKKHILQNIIKKIQIILDKNNYFECQILAPLWRLFFILKEKT